MNLLVYSNIKLFFFFLVQRGILSLEVVIIKEFNLTEAPADFFFHQDLGDPSTCKHTILTNQIPR